MVKSLMTIKDIRQLAKLEAEIGKTVRIRKGSGLTAMLPTDGIPDHLKDNVIIVDPANGV